VKDKVLAASKFFFNSMSTRRNVRVTAFAIASCFVTASALVIAAPRLVANGVYARLPNGWVIEKPQSLVTLTDTMPQGAAASPDGRTLAVVESGFNPPTLRIYGTSDLSQLASIPLPGAFGRPVWIDANHVLVAGANADALFEVDVVRQVASRIVMPKGSYPTMVAMSHGTFAVGTDGDFSVRIGSLNALSSATPIKVGGHIGGLAFAPDGGTLFASNRSGRYVEEIDPRTLAARKIATTLHPSDVLPIGSAVYVAETDADSVGMYDESTGRRLENIFVGDFAQPRVAGVSPNALARHDDALFVSLGAANSIAIVRNGRVVGRIPAGWYPTDVVPLGNRLYIVNGKGEGTRPNPYFNARDSKSNYDYVASIQYGSIRIVDLSRHAVPDNPQGATGWQAVRSSPILRPDGPIRHVFFILKENRSYDQVLGDIPAGNGDPKLAWFGSRVTPNQHAFAARFGIFDNAYASGEVSESGHNWADAAFVNDYIERTWPASYGDRGGVDDSLSAVGMSRNGYIWQAAKAAGVSFRDYGEMTIPNTNGQGQYPVPSLVGLYDPRYVGWNLDYSDLDRVKEWRREFDSFVRHGDVPQLEYIWLPNDHTAGSRLGKLTPVAYVATNDYAVGLIVDAISHSPVWRSSAIFITEDDAQDGPDHVSDQRTTLFLVSPYASGGLEHAHYSTVSVVRTMELLLGLPSLSTYDGMAVPLSAAFSRTPHLRPYDAILPKVNGSARNGKLAFGAALSGRMNFRRPDANPPGMLAHIIARNHSIVEAARHSARETP
jgi:DNA-binding beta-propeller fold protein YncE